MSEPTEFSGPTPVGTPFTSHELLYMLALNPSDAADTTRKHLRLGDPLEPGTPLYAAGATTLRIRGKLDTDGERLVPGEEVQALTAMLTKADRWVEIGLLDRQRVEGALLISAADYAGMLTANELGIFTVVALESAEVLPTAAARVVRGFLDRHQPAAASVNVTAAGAERRCVINHGEDGRWRIGTEPVQDDGNLTPADIEESEVDDFVISLVVGGDPH